MTIDPKAWALADHFLAPVRHSTAGHVRELAEWLQDIAEDYAADLRHAGDPPDPRLAARKALGHQ